MSISAFLLIFARLAALLLSLPLFGRGLPPLARGALVFTLALALKTQLPPPETPYLIADSDLLAALVCEVLLGLLISLLVRLLLDVAEVAGEMLSLPLGLSLSQLLNNESDEQIVLSGQLMQIAAWLLLLSDTVFLRMVLTLLQHNFIAIPRASALLNGDEGLVKLLLNAFSAMFEQALLLALPLLLLMLLLFTAMGIASRIIPQLNLLILGLPLQLAMGLLLLLMLAVPLSQDLASYLGRGLEQLPQQLKELLPVGGKT